jgi:hypothetical protein
MNKGDLKQWLAIRKEAGLQIDADAAEVEWTYAYTLDPYGIHPELPEELQQVGRAYFARSPGSDVWVEFGDLPDATRKALWERHKSKLAFPAGLFLPLRPALPQSPEGENAFQVYGNGQGELGIVGEGCFVHVRIEQAPMLIEKMRAVLEELEDDAA